MVRTMVSGDDFPKSIEPIKKSKPGVTSSAASALVFPIDH